MDYMIIYGAGKKGQTCLQMLKKYGLDGFIMGFCDKRADSLGKCLNKPVYSYEHALQLNIPFILAVKKEYAPEVVDKLKRDSAKVYEELDVLLVDELHLFNRVDYEREFCAISHIDTMDEYFDKAEENDSINIFWKNDSTFYRCFRKLNLDSVVELACGRGRHVPRYLDDSKHVTLVDVLDKNIDFCRRRFSQFENIDYVVNNGFDLASLKDDSYTSIFTYDAMVHFELLDIANYLNESYRVLKRGCAALYHHSNNYSDYKASYADAIESRSFMSDKIFAYLAYRAGFEVIEQHLIDWKYPELDCLTLVRKK